MRYLQKASCEQSCFSIIVLHYLSSVRLLIIRFNFFRYYFQGWEKCLTTKWIHIIDSGGQPEFHDLLPVLVPNSSLVLFVFKLSEGLDEKPTVEYYGPDGPIGDSYKSYLMHREILEHCLKVFYAQDPKMHPTILLIGTHKDHPEQRLNIKELNECLKPFQQDVIHFGDESIAVLNCRSKENADMDIVQNIRKQLHLEVHKDIKNELKIVEMK